MTLYRSRVAADIAAERLKVYAQPQRLMILSRLLDGEHTVSEIDAATGIGQPALSQQLAELRRAEIVKTRRESKLIHYRLADEKIKMCVQSIETIFGGEPGIFSALQCAHLPAGPHLNAPAPKGAAAFARLG